MRSSKRLMPLESLTVKCTRLFINKDSLVTFLNGVVVMHYSSIPIEAIHNHLSDKKIEKIKKKKKALKLKSYTKIYNS